MGKQKEDGISWTNFTFNCWHGCSRVEGSPACCPSPGQPEIVCYAEKLSELFGYSGKPGAAHFPIWGAHAGRRYFGDKHWNELHRWNKEWAKEGSSQARARVFIMSMGDWAEGRPDQQEHLTRLWVICEQTPNLDKLMLTKRPQLISKLCPLKNDPRIWQGTTAENQYWFDIRWRHLREVEALIKWFSLEPQVGPIELPQDFLDLGSRGWIVCGGQHCAGAIEFDPVWARRLRDQCREAGVAFHMKQMSGNRKADLQAIPVDLRIREFPLTQEFPA